MPSNKLFDVEMQLFLDGHDPQAFVVIPDVPTRSDQRDVKFPVGLVTM